MAEQVRIVAIHKHYRDQSFIMIAERGARGQYVVCVDSGGTPWKIAKVEGLVTVSYKYHGSYTLEIHAQSMGRDDPILDPICEVLLRKNWSRSVLRMRYLEYEPLWNTMTQWALRTIKPGWDGSQEKYLITELPTSRLRTYGPDWAIQVHLADNGYISVNVGVPEVYETDQLGKLLKAIKSLPDADKMSHVHPAMLAKAS